MRSLIVVFRLLGIVVFTAVHSTAFSQTKVESVVVAQAGQTPGSFSFTPLSKSGLRGLSLLQKGSRFVYAVDGVEGPRFDRTTGMNPVITDDGARYAYTAIIGTDAILVIDGKEAARAPAQNGQSPFIKYGFSQNGKRSWYVQDGISASSGILQRLTVDGKAVGEFAGFGDFVFSPDESRYAVLVTKHLDRREFLFLDGKDVGFQGDSPRFSPDGKNVLTLGRTPENDVLIINGRQAARAPIIHGVHMSTGGLNLLVLSPSRNASGDQAQFLGTGGKKLEGSECANIEKVVFSPDGKRYAALCRLATGGKFLFLDGKRGLPYDQILDFRFTPDSSKAIYVATSGGKQFFVSGEDESDGYQTLQPVLLSADGKHIGFLGRVAGSNDCHIVIDGKVVAKPRGASLLVLSADGSRYGFLGGPGPHHALFLDGVEQKGFGVSQPNYVATGGPYIAISPDGKYVAHHGFVGDISGYGLVLNGKLVDPKRAIWNVPLFTADSRHILYFRAVPGGGFELVVDGTAAVKFNTIPIFTKTYGVEPFELGADGVFTFLGEQDGALKRFRVTPGSDTSVESMLAASSGAARKG